MSKTQLRKEIDAEVKAMKRGGNTGADKLMMGAAAAGMCVLAWHEVLRHVRATYPMNMVLAGIAIGGLLYLIMAPTFRR